MHEKSPARITSVQNPKIKALVRLGDRKERDQQRLFAVEGLREVLRAIEGDFKLRELLWCEDILSNAGKEFLISKSALAKEVSKIIISEEVFAKLAVRSGSDGIICVFEYKEQTLKGLSLDKKPFLLLTEDVEKPGNLGAILRTANGAGVDAVLVLSRGVDPYNPNVIRSSLGAVFATPVICCSNEDAEAFCRAKNIQVVVASPEAKHGFSDFPGTGGVAILVGSEAHGVSPFWKGKTTIQVAIPMAGEVDSLNVSVAAGIMMYEVRRQRGDEY